MINKQNLIEYLKFLEPKLGKTFSAETLSAWANIPDADVNMRLQKMYANLDWEATTFEAYEKDFIAQQPITPVTPVSINITPAVKPNVGLSNFSPNTENIETIPFAEVSNTEPISIEAPKPNTITEIAAQYQNNKPADIAPNTTVPAVTSTATALPQTNTTQTTITPLQVPKKRGIIGKIIGGLFFLFLLAGGYVGYKYYQYVNLNSAYSLADNLAIHESNDDVSKIIGRMDLFESVLKPNGEIEKTLNGLKVIGTNGDYTKILVDANFKDFLFNNDKNFGFINSKYITTSNEEYEKYKNIFGAFKNDHNEMDKLQYNYRKLIVTAFNEFKDFKGATLATPSLIETKLSDKAPLSIGQIKEKDNLNNIKNIYAAVQLSNGQYYTIKGNKEGTKVEQVWPMVIRTLAVAPKPTPRDTLSIGTLDIEIPQVISDIYNDPGKPEERTNLTTKGKFKVNNGNPQELIFTAADNSISARTRYAPYNVLVKY